MVWFLMSYGSYDFGMVNRRRFSSIRSFNVCLTFSCFQCKCILNNNNSNETSNEEHDTQHRMQ